MKPFVAKRPDHATSVARCALRNNTRSAKAKPTPDRPCRFPSACWDRTWVAALLSVLRAGGAWLKPYWMFPRAGSSGWWTLARSWCSLPEDEVGKLGLSQGGRVIVTYADDRREELPTARGLEVSLLGRSMVTDCVIGPPCASP